MKILVKYKTKNRPELWYISKTRMCGALVAESAKDFKTRKAAIIACAQLLRNKADAVQIEVRP